MVRQYVRKKGARDYLNYTADTLEQCLRAIESGKMSERMAAKVYSIPRSTIHNKRKKKHSGKHGGKRVFSDEVEDLFAHRVNIMCDWGFPLDYLDLKLIIKAYLEKKKMNVKCFRNNLPGDDWVKGFMKRRGLTNRYSSNIKRKRAAVSKSNLETYFDNIKEELTGIPAANIWNYDETNLSDDPGKKKCIMRRGHKYPERVVNHSKVAYSIMFCGNAAGEVLAPYTVYKANHIYPNWIKGGPKDARYNVSDSGWFDQVTFEDWFFSVALPKLRKQEGRKILIGDNLSSHMNEKVIAACNANNIGFICLFPNATHMLQPLDVAFFAPLKRSWRKILTEWKQKASGRKNGTLTKQEYPALLAKLLLKLTVNAENNLKNGFRKCGIFPFNPEEVYKRLPQIESDKSAAAADLDSSLVDLLKDHRGLEESTTAENSSKKRNSKKNRIKVASGKSVSMADIQEEPAQADPASNAVKQGEKRKRAEQSEESNQESLEGSKRRKRKRTRSVVLNRPAKKSVTNERHRNPVESIGVSSYVAVSFEGAVFPGQVVSIVPEGYKVSCLTKRSQGGWRWPDKEDVEVYEEVLYPLAEPQKISKRGTGTFKIPELEHIWGS